MNIPETFHCHMWFKMFDINNHLKVCIVNIHVSLFRRHWLLISLHWYDNDTITRKPYLLSSIYLFSGSSTTGKAVIITWWYFFPGIWSSDYCHGFSICWSLSGKLSNLCVLILAHVVIMYLAPDLLVCSIVAIHRPYYDMACIYAVQFQLVSDYKLI